MGTRGMKFKCTQWCEYSYERYAHGVADITFVNDSEIGGVNMYEFESDSDDEEDVYLGSDEESEVSQEVFHPVSMTRSGRRVRTFVHFV